MKYIVHTDGGARGNPGPGAVGVVIQCDNNTVAAFGKKIGETTNNVAEYAAVLEGLQNVKYQMSNAKYENSNNITIHFYLDSNLVVQQLNGKFKVKDPTLRDLLMRVRVLEQDVGGAISYYYVPRAQNRRADSLVNQALDASPHVSLL